MIEKNSKVDQLLDELLKDAKGTQEIPRRVRIVVAPIE